MKKILTLIFMYSLFTPLYSVNSNRIQEYKDCKKRVYERFRAEYPKCKGIRDYTEKNNCLKPLYQKRRTNNKACKTECVKNRNVAACNAIEASAAVTPTRKPEERAREEAQPAQNEEQRSEQAAQPAGEPPFKKNYIGLFGGGVTPLNNTVSLDNSDYILGLEYEMRFSKMLGAGIQVNTIFVSPLPLIVMPAVYVHPFGGLKAWLGGGIIGQKNTTSAFIGRLGVGYDIPAGPVAISPIVFADLTRSVVSLNYGISAGLAF